jgi:hypothetical protein
MKRFVSASKDTIRKVGFVGLMILPVLIVLNTTYAACTAEAGEQCLELDVSGTGALTLDVPADFSFGTQSSPSKSYSKDDSAYTLNVNDLITVSDMRGSAGFNLQLQADSAGFTDSAGDYLPLQGFYVVTTAADTGGTAVNGVEYAGTDTSPKNIVAYQDADINPAGGGLQQSKTFTACGSALGGGSTFHTPGTATPVDLMVGGISPLEGRKGTFRQNVNFYLSVPGGQPQGDYTAVLTYTLIDSTTEPPAQPPACNP